MDLSIDLSRKLAKALTKNHYIFDTNQRIFYKNEYKIITHAMYDHFAKQWKLDAWDKLTPAFSMYELYKMMPKAFVYENVIYRLSIENSACYYNSSFSCIESDHGIICDSMANSLLWLMERGIKINQKSIAYEQPKP